MRGRSVEGLTRRQVGDSPAAGRMGALRPDGKSHEALSGMTVHRRPGPPGDRGVVHQALDEISGEGFEWGDEVEE